MNIGILIHMNLQTVSLKPRTYSFLFKLSMWWRILYGGIRILFALALLKFVGTPLSELLFPFVSHEIGGTKKDALFRFLYHTLHDYSFTITYFLAFYFLFWGTVDIVLSLGLLARKLWAFPFSLILIALFILYALYRFSNTHSLVLLSIIILDVFIFALIFREYRIAKRTDPLLLE